MILLTGNQSVNLKSPFFLICSTSPPSSRSLIITGGKGSICTIVPLVRFFSIPFSISSSSSSPASIESVSHSIASKPILIAFL